MREHGSALLYAHGNHKARSDGKPRRATSTLTQLLDSDTDAHSLMHFESGIWEVRRLVPFSSSFSLASVHSTTCPGNLIWVSIGLRGEHQFCGAVGNFAMLRADV